MTWHYSTLEKEVKVMNVSLFGLDLYMMSAGSCFCQADLNYVVEPVLMIRSQLD